MAQPDEADATDVSRSPTIAHLEGFLKPPAASDSGANGQLLVVMNEPELGVLLFYCLTAAGFRVRLASRDADGAREVEREMPEVVLLDSRLPDGRSTEIWRQIRAASGGVRSPAVIMFIGGEEDIDPRLGLEFGPCDFVVYPLSVRDLVLRIDRIIAVRREMAAAAPGATERRRPPRTGRYLVGPLDLDTARQTTLVSGAPVALSPLELQVLTYLVEHRDRVCTRGDLLADVWGYRPGVASRATDVHVNRLRVKLGPAGRLIETIRGAGYRLSAEHPVIETDLPASPLKSLRPR
ncbi:MAG TPA: response regulator transcription factor [Polyangia bacterium]